MQTSPRLVTLLKQVYCYVYHGAALIPYVYVDTGHHIEPLPSLHVSLLVYSYSFFAKILLHTQKI